MGGAAADSVSGVMTHLQNMEALLNVWLRLIFNHRSDARPGSEFGFCCPGKMEEPVSVEPSGFLWLLSFSFSPGFMSKVSEETRGGAVYGSV